MRPDLYAADGTEYCDFRISPYDCRGDSIFMGAYKANIALGFLSAAAGVFLLLWRHFQGRLRFYHKGKFGAIDGLVVGIPLHAFISAIYGILMVCNVWGPAWQAREGLFLVIYDPALLGIANYFLSMFALPCLLSFTGLLVRSPPTLFHAIFNRGETVPPSLVADRSCLSRVLSIKLLAKIGFSLNLLAIAWSFCGFATGYFHDHGAVAAELTALHVTHLGFGVIMVLLSITSAVIGFQVVRMFFNITRDLKQHQPTRTVSISFMTSTTPAESTSNLVQSKHQAKPGEYTQQVLWGDIMKMAGINLLIATILMCYGVGCILLGSWDSFFTSEPFIFVIGCLSINGSCITCTIAVLFLVVMEIRAKWLMDKEADQLKRVEQPMQSLKGSTDHSNGSSGYH